MKTPSVKMIAKAMVKTCKQHSPVILTVVGIGGLITAGVMAVKETPKALQLIEEEKEVIAEETNAPVEEVELTIKEKVQATWRCYVPSAVTSVVSTACLIGACRVNAKRTAALAAAYQISQTALHQYKDAIIETVGEKKAKAIDNKVVEKRLEPVQQQVVNYNVSDDSRANVLCFDNFSGRVFRTSLNRIESASSKLHDKMDLEDYSSLNYAYDLIGGLDRISVGDVLGWNTERHGKISIDSSPMMLQDGRPCICVKFVNCVGEELFPETEYDRYY